MEKLEGLSNEDRYLHAAEEILVSFIHADINATTGKVVFKLNYFSV